MDNIKKSVGRPKIFDGTVTSLNIKIAKRDLRVFSDITRKCNINKSKLLRGWIKDFTEDKKEVLSQ